jgi:hypothetical protein
MTLALAIAAISLSTIALALLARREHRIWRDSKNPRPGDITDRIQRSLGRS